MKKLILITLAATALLSLFSCEKKEEGAPKPLTPTVTVTTQEAQTSEPFGDTDAPATEQTETEAPKTEAPKTEAPETEAFVTDAPETEAPAPEVTGPAYTSDLLSVYGCSDRRKDVFSALLGHTDPYLLTTDNKLYFDPFGWEDQVGYDTEETFSSYAVFADTVAWYDVNGYLHVWDRNEYLCSNFIGEPLWSFQGMLDGNLYLITREGDRLYVNGYKKNGFKDVFDNTPLCAYDFTTKTHYDSFRTVDIRVANGLTYVYLETADGVRLFDTVTGIDSITGQTSLWMDRLDSKADRLLDFGYNYSFTSPLYTESDTATRLTFTEGWDGDPLYIHLPDGYTAADVKEALFGSLTVVVFEDGTVWCGELNHTVVGTTLVKCDELSALMQQGVIRELHLSTAKDTFVSNCHLLVLCDDNVVYAAAGDALTAR